EHQCGTHAGVVVDGEDTVADAAADEWAGHLNPHLDAVGVDDAAAKNERAIAIAGAIDAVKLSLAAAENDVVDERIDFSASQIHGPAGLVAGKKSEEVVCTVGIKFVTQFPDELSSGCGGVAECN